MNIRHPVDSERNAPLSGRTGQEAFSLVEVIVGFSILCIVFLSLLGSFSSGFALVQTTRENQRATQILLEKMEVIRLYSWDQLLTPDFVPSNFVTSFFATNDSLNGLVYTGEVEISPAPVSEVYANDLRLVTVTLKWVSGDKEHNREMSTFVSRYGLQNYILQK